MQQQVLFYTYAVTLLLSGVMALVYRKSLQENGLAILCYFLPLVFIQEAVLHIVTSIDRDFSTRLIYNIYRPISVIVFAVLYAGLPVMKTWKKWIGWLTISYLLLIIGYHSFIEPPYTANSYLSLLRSFLITLYAVFFLFSYFNLDSKTEEKKWRPVLWITIGIVTFYPVTSITFAFQEYLAPAKGNIYSIKVYQIIPRLMSIFMYSSFSYAFYLCQKKN